MVKEVNEIICSASIGYPVDIQSVVAVMNVTMDINDKGDINNSNIPGALKHSSNSIL